MSFWDELGWSWRHFRRQLFESTLVILAIALGAAVIVTVLSLFFSVNQEYRQVEQADHFRTFHILSGLEMSARQNIPLVLLGEELTGDVWEASLDELDQLQSRLPDHMHVFVEQNWLARTPLLTGKEEKSDQAEFFLGMGPSDNIFLTGSTDRYFSFKGMSLQKGSWFLPEDVQNQNRVLVLGSQLALELFGEDDPLGQAVPLEAFGDQYLQYTVIGVLNPQGEEEPSYLALQMERSGYLPVTALPYPSGGGGTALFRRVLVGVDPGVDLVKAQELLTAEARLLWGDQVAVQSPLAEFREMRGSLKRYALLIGVFASVGLIIAVLNILNLMLARVIKRTKSIGLALALGGHPGLVFRQFLLEALAMGIAGSLLGTGLSFALSSLLKRLMGVALAGAGFFGRLFWGLLIGFLTSLLFGVYPAYRGSRVNPVDALRTE